MARIVGSSSLSAGLVFREVLCEDEAVRGLTKGQVFPVLTAEAKLPYVMYRRTSLDREPTKTGGNGADTVREEVHCYAETYAGSVELAEAVREALDCRQIEGSDGLVLRSCFLVGSQEDYDEQGGAYVQVLVFEARL